jgi:taurine dioxygenase
VRPYGPEGFYANETHARSMKILPRPDARNQQLHPIVRVHPATARRALFVNRVYTIAIDGVPPDEAAQLLAFLCDHATRDALVYRHRWQADMLVVWDNRCVQHSAQGGYDGFRRVMHRTTVAGEVPIAA